MALSGLSFWLDLVDVGVSEVLDPLALVAPVLVPIPVPIPCSSNLNHSTVVVTARVTHAANFSIFESYVLISDL